MAGGGILVIIATILDWGPGTSGLSTDGFTGLLGILSLLVGLAVLAVGGVKAFSPSTRLPASLAGFTMSQLAFTGAFAVFVWTFSLIGEDGVKFGVHLAWIGAAIVCVGAVLDNRGQAAASGETRTI